MRLLSSKGGSQNIQLHKVFQGSLPKVVFSMSAFVIQETSKEWQWTKKEFWKIYIREKILAKRLVVEPQAKISTLVILNFLAVGWLIFGGIIKINFSYNLAKGETVESVREIKNQKINPRSLVALNVEDNKNGSLNQVVLSQDEKCAEYKEKGISANDCQKNADEIMNQWKKEEQARIARTVRIKPRVSAPMPSVYVISGGRLMCNKGSHDKPQKSDQHKGKHMDMECCLDPDEVPNPHCFYSQAKYGKYL